MRHPTIEKPLGEAAKVCVQLVAWNLSIAEVSSPVDFNLNDLTPGEVSASPKDKLKAGSLEESDFKYLKNSCQRNKLGVCLLIWSWFWGIFF